MLKLRKTMAALTAVMLLAMPTIFAAEDLESILVRMQAKVDELKGKVTNIKVEAESKLFMDGEEPIIVKNILYQKGDKMRADMIPQGDMGEEVAATVMISDGKSLWLLSQGFGAQEMPMDIGAAEMGQQDVTGAAWLASIKDKIVFDGEEGGLYRFLMQEPIPTKVWLDKNDFYMVKMEQSTPDGVVKVERSDFRDIKDGVKIPYKTNVYLDDEMISEVMVTNVTPQATIPDALFDVEAVKKELNITEETATFGAEELTKLGQ